MDCGLTQRRHCPPAVAQSLLPERVLAQARLWYVQQSLSAPAGRMYQTRVDPGVVGWRRRRRRHHGRPVRAGKLLAGSAAWHGCGARADDVQCIKFDPHATTGTVGQASRDHVLLEPGAMSGSKRPTQLAWRCTPMMGFWPHSRMPPAAATSSRRAISATGKPMIRLRRSSFALVALTRSIGFSLPGTAIGSAVTSVCPTSMPTGQVGR